jgi:cystathionine beta-lyase
MKYDFNKVLDRRGSNSLKWDTGSSDVLPMWVADMDLPIAEPIIEALKKKVDHRIFGYSITTDEYYDAAIGFFKRRHGITYKKEWFSHAPGIVPALHFFANCFMEKGDKVLMNSPVYYPFFGSAYKNDIGVEFNELKVINDRYEIDFEDFEKKASDDKVKMFYMSNPHNPGGRMFTSEELRKMGDICVDNNVIIVSDEIHCDLLYNGNKHVSMASLSEKIQQNTITCIAPSKTFNVAGLQTSCLIIPNVEIKEKYDKFLASIGIMRPNVFGITALTAAYNEGDEWLDQLLEYLHGNLNFMRDYISENIPKMKIMEPDATYLIWLDFRDMNIDSREFHDIILNDGKVWLDEGYIFGEVGQGFERINIACPRVTLEEGLNRIKVSLEKAGKI